MTITSIITGDSIELDWSEAVQDWQDPVRTEPVEMPQGSEWMDRYLQLMLEAK